MDALSPQSAIFWTRVGTALLSGAIVGLERQLRGKPAGIRTSILICMGSMLFVMIGEAAVDGSPGDRGRVLAQIITGIGFLGAGVILNRQDAIVGVTSAATIWILAAIGAGIGFGYEQTGLAMALLTVAVLIGVEMLEAGVRALRRGVHRHPGDPPDPNVSQTE